MKKTILIMIVAVATMFSFNSMAQSPKCEGKKCDKAMCDKSSKCEIGKGQHKHKACPNPFEGLNLTPEQQDKLKAMAPCGAKEQRKACQQEQRRHRQACDSIARAGKEKFLADVKSVLTPEQYVQFLENMAKQPRPDMMKGPKPCMKKGFKGPKGDRCPQKADCKKADCKKAADCQKQCPKKK